MRTLTAILGICLLVSFNSQAQQVKPDKIVAPQWELYDEQNKLTRSSDFKDKPLIIHFWATWCPYCKKLQPGLDRLYKKYQSQGLEVIAISFWEDEGATPQASLIERGHSFKTLVNGDHVAKQLFGVKGTPTTVFISKDGSILATTRISDPNDPRLEKIIKQMVASPNQ
jgi:thiol-disulfide isomerase/thioredoxin